MTFALNDFTWQVSTPNFLQSHPCLKPLQQVQNLHSGNQNSEAYADRLPPCPGVAPAGKNAPPELLLADLQYKSSY